MDVDQSGNLNIVVPINLYENPRGLTPGVSLVYNSASTVNGLLGVGWNIGGVSAITRGNKSYYYDGYVEGQTVTSSQSGTNKADQTFMLDGMRLIYRSTGTNYRIYESEQGQIKVYGYCLSSTNTTTMVEDYFEAHYPDGRKAIFGYKNTSTGIAQMIYPLTEITDPFNNSIKYTYSLSSNVYRLTKITYGEGQKMSVDFKYEYLNTPASTHYMAGLKQSYSYRLSSIETKFNNTLLFTYSTEYITKENAAVIKKIKCSSTERAVNDLNFYHGEVKSASTYLTDELQLGAWYNFSDPAAVRAVKGKFDYGTDNDGIILLPNKVHYLEYRKDGGLLSHSKQYIENQYKSDDQIIIIPGLYGKMSLLTNQLSVGEGFIDIFCADLDETEGEEIIKVNNVVSGNRDKLDFHVYRSDLNNGIAKKYTRTFYFESLLEHYGKYSINPKYYFTGDFTGNGKMEVLVVSAYDVMGKGEKSKCYLLDL